MIPSVMGTLSVPSGSVTVGIRRARVTSLSSWTQFQTPSDGGQQGSLLRHPAIYSQGYGYTESHPEREARTQPQKKLELQSWSLTLPKREHRPHERLQRHGSAQPAVRCEPRQYPRSKQRERIPRRFS